ncbi:MAG: LEA type 2 family protein, partial [Acidobacteria bacterium]|nr:LEA type 2 family protein [Acidobacteriota bacterium]
DQLRGLVQPPTFAQADGQPAEIRLIGPRADLPLGGAGVRLWTRVTNPNPFGLTLGSLRGSLLLEGTHAANADFPLGLPMRPGEASTIPIDVSISFADLPGLAEIVRRAANRQPLAYRFDGTIGVDAGRFGQPVFGPMTLWSGTTAGQ